MGMLKRNGSCMQYLKPKKEDCYDIDLKSATDGEGRRMGRGEQDMLVTLYGAALMMNMVLEKEAMKQRIGSIPRGWQRIKTAHTNIHNLIVDIFKTVPKDQMEHMKRQLGATNYFSYVGRNPLTFEKDIGRWLNMKELDMVAQVCKEQCKYCTLVDAQEQRQCIVNKIMRLLPVDNYSDGKDACGWFEELGSI